MTGCFPTNVLADERDAILAAVHRAGTGPPRKLILGESVLELEQAVGEQTGAEHVVACASGTAAITLALDGLGVGPGDGVVVPAFCFPSVASTVVERGATPVFVDVDPVTMVMRADELEAAIGTTTRAVMPAHLFSTMADMEEIRALAERHGIAVLEDAACAHGASLGGRQAGRFGDVGVLSFFPLKALGGPGEGGVVVTDDERVATRCRMLRNHGQDGKTRFLHHLVGRNSRMDEVLAEVLLARLETFADRFARRAALAARYDEHLAPLHDAGLTLPPPGRDGRFHYVYAVQTDRREELRAHLAGRGVETHVYFPAPLPDQPAFAPHANGGPWPNAAAAARQHLALPLNDRLGESDVDLVIDAVLEFFAA